MVKKTKYPNGELSDEEERIIDRFTFLYVGVYFALIQEYRTAKKFGEEVLVKKMNSDINLARLYTLTSIINSPVNHLFKPWEINDQLVKDIQNTIDKTYGDIKIETETQDNKNPIRRFLNSRNLRERVLEYFEKQGIFLHLEDKKKIKRQQAGTQRPGRKKSSGYIETYDTHGGKPSAYRATEEVERVKQLMKKPAAIDLLYKRLIGSGVAHPFFKFNLLAYLYAIKMDKRVIHRTAGLGASFLRYDLKEKDIADYNATFEILQTFDDNRLEQCADNMIKYVKDLGYYAIVFALGVLGGGLLKI
jgi:hypothetical protein